MLVDHGSRAQRLPTTREEGPSLYFLASNGDHDAQVEMAQMALAEGVAGQVPMPDALVAAINWSHMATTSTRASHLLAYAGVLLSLASYAVSQGTPEEDCSEQLAAALAIVDKAADAGHSGAEMLSFALASRMSAIAVARAKVLRELVNIAPMSLDEKQQDQGSLEWLANILTSDNLGSC